MDEQDTSQLTVNDKINSDVILQEIQPQKITSEENSESQLGISSEVYAGAENEVITIVDQETDEIYIYDRNDVNTPAENSEEYIQVCDSNSEFEEVSNSEEKEVNVDGIEEEEKKEEKEKEKEIETEKQTGKEKEDSKEKKEESEEESQKKTMKFNQELKDTKEENAEEEESGSKNFKNVILEDWEVDVPHIIESQDSENITETIVVEEEPEEVISYNNENSNIIEFAEPEVIEVIGETNEENPIFQKEQSLKEENLVAIPKKSSEEQKSSTVLTENSKVKHSILTQNSRQENSLRCQVDNLLLIHNENPNIKEVTPQLVEKRLEALKCSKSVTKEEIVKILDDSSERVIRPIVGGKDLFFSIELTKRLNQKLSLGKGKTSEASEKSSDSDSCNNNNTVDDRQKIIEILEADDIKDWKSVPSKSDLSTKENGNDMEIIKAIKSMEEVDSKAKITTTTTTTSVITAITTSTSTIAAAATTTTTTTTTTTNTKISRKTPLKKLRTMDKELERTLALQQLREEFPSTRKRSRTTKKVNHIPFLASTVLEKAMTSPEVTTALKPGHPKRRPCYLPDNVTYSKSKDISEVVKVKNKESVSNGTNGTKTYFDLRESDFELSNNSIPNPIVKTYSVKRKSTDTESDIKTTLEAVAKALNESTEKISEPKPKKHKTVTKENKNNKILIRKKRKLKPGVKSDKKVKSELEKLLGDEGAVRMLYDTQHADTSTTASKKTKFKTTTGLRKDLMLKTKLVKNAVMRLSGVGTDGVFLRGKRRSICQPVASNLEEEPLFSSTPNIVLYKPKKKQRAEASRILYRHSSSESFESSEGYRRTSFDTDGLNVEPANNTLAEDSKPVLTTVEKTPLRGKLKKPDIIKKKLKDVKETNQKKSGKGKGNFGSLSTGALSMGGSKINLSNVPIRKSSRPRVVSKKYSVWSSTSMDCLSVESLGLKKLKKASTELGKKLNCKELTILQYEHLVQIVLTPTSMVLKNSLNNEVLQELVNVFNYLSEYDSCRVVLLSSRGSTFCQGIDINRIISFSETEKKKGVIQLIKAITEFVICLARFKKPVIAGVQGSAVGFGVTLLPYCDLIISSDTASFYTPYVKLGQAPEGAPIYTFPNINRQLVSELLFKSHKMTAADALKLGLVTQVIPEERFEEDLIMISRNMASQPIQGLQSIKFLLRTCEQRDVSEALQVEGQLLEEHWNSPECLNNMIKFLNSGELQLKQNVNG